MRSPIRTDIKDKKSFERFGYLYEQVLGDDGNHIYLYRLTPLNYEQRYHQYELVRGKKYRNPGGETVWVYPCDEDFGTFGWYICGTAEKVVREVSRIWRSFTNYPPDFSL